MIEMWSRKAFAVFSTAAVLFILLVAQFWSGFAWLLLPLALFVVVGVHDIRQQRHTLLRNFPVFGHFRWLLEGIRPEIRQYFVESDSEENPISREKRSVVYQRAKQSLDTLPFGTRRDVYRIGYEWINHSVRPVEVDPSRAWTRIGGPDCQRPYRASIFNISAMSYGALSSNAILALNRGAKLGGFYHNTGEGGISPYHLQGDGDLVWQIGTGYFGCRRKDGAFCPATFERRAAQEAVKMIEIKLSQGAKPGHGGILPAAKITPEIAAIRDVHLGQDVLSPPAHSAFSTPIELLKFIQELRELSGGKPVGFKLCLGDMREFLGICKAMLQSDIAPDFITVDGAEGGTGAAPLEFSNSVGVPLNEGLSFVHSALVGCGLREKVRIIAAGKITTGFHLLTKVALGADACNAARSMMFALGCVQALKCNSNQCPTGVATQDPRLVKGLVVSDKAQRVANFHKAIIASALELMGASGLSCVKEKLPWHIYRRVDGANIKPFGEIYPVPEEGALLTEALPEPFRQAWERASAEHFSGKPVEGEFCRWE